MIKKSLFIRVDVLKGLYITQVVRNIKPHKLMYIFILSKSHGQIENAKQILINMEERRN